MDWQSILLGMVLGIVLLPALLLMGFRLILWLLARRLRRWVQEAQSNANLQASSFGWDLKNPPGSRFEEGVLQQLALAPEADLEEQLRQNFLAKTQLQPEEWEAIQSRLVFVHDQLEEEQLLEYGIEGSDEQDPRQAAAACSHLTLLGSLNQPLEADVYVRGETREV